MNSQIASLNAPELVADLPRLNNGVYYKQLIDELPAAIYTCDVNGYIVFYNKAAAQLWGREPELGKDLWCGSWKIYDTAGNYVSLDTCPMAIALKEGRSVRGQEVVVVRPDGARLNVLPHPDPIFNEKGEMIGAVNMLVDITELREARQANSMLKRNNEHLEQFAYAASHDMQEPLRKIHTFSSLVLERHGKQLDQNGKKYLSKVIQSSSRMNSIINDLLEFSHVSLEEEMFTEVDLDEIVNKIRSDLELLITDKNALITSTSLPVIIGIPSQLNRLFYNLLHNALKFSAVDPIIDVSCKNHGDFIEIKITDNGIGFDQQYSEKIFGLFQRLNDKQSYSGNGIGLALCKKIVENHNGNISVRSEPGRGTSFCLQFPSSTVVS